eukprot:TRINITY_DN112983_c0_g1_i1.p1 TRINITY_DN112983_c0_g1~~TRINITY_DN112983_c0_g1_i1.p1  ORF type:complete len:165 (-),score=24.22 TRINITY_DN112983_c0_g1_i1:142-585(-)
MPHRSLERITAAMARLLCLWVSLQATSLLFAGPRRAVTEVGGYDCGLRPLSRGLVARPAAKKTKSKEAYSPGDYGSNTCPDGYTKIADVSTCQTAAEASGLNLNFLGEGDWPDNPGGCYYWFHSGSAFFNANEGSERKNTRPLCLKK